MPTLPCAAFNVLSRGHRDFIAAGGLVPLIGDGQLNCRQEPILETDYAWNIFTGTTLTFDHQLPRQTRKADRGPVNIFSRRLHAEF
jgi:high affinity Mn2+ porin